MKKIYYIPFFLPLFIVFSYGGDTLCKDNGYLNFGKDKNLSRLTLAKIIKKNPNDLNCALKLIHIYLKSAEVEKGFELLVKINSIDPEFIKHKKIHKILNIALYVINLKKRAIKNSDIKSWNMLGATYYKMGVFNESIKAYNTSLKIDPNQIEPRLTLALDFSRSAQAYRALEELNKVIKLDKDNFYAYYYAGKILKYQIRDIKKADIYLKKAMKLCVMHKRDFSKNIYKEYMKDLKSEIKK